MTKAEETICGETSRDLGSTLRRRRVPVSLPAASHGCRASKGKSVETSMPNSPCSFLTLLFGSSWGQERFSESVHFLSQNVKCLDEAEDDSREKARLLATTF